MRRGGPPRVAPPILPSGRRSSIGDIRVLIDTCVLFPQSARGVLLQLAQREFIRPLWGDRILAELQRNLVPDHMRPESCASMLDALRRVWPEAWVEGWEPLESSMPTDAGDAHVMAAAVRGRADVLVTQHSLGLRRPPLGVAQIVAALETHHGCREFPARVRAQLDLLPGGGPDRWYPVDPERPPFDPDGEAWFCVATNSFPCGDESCDFVATTMTAGHRTVVWRDRDDPSLLRHAQEAQECCRNPVIVEFRPEMGPAISYYEWEATRNPIHGRQPDPTT